MSVLDFLFEGKPPKSTTTYGQTIENVPKWMSDYTQGLISRANAAAAEPYIPYGGPRIAGFTPDQLQGFEEARGAAGAYEPYLEGATAATADVMGGPSPLEQAQPYLGAGTEEFPDAVGRYMDPYVGNVLDRQEALATRTLEEKFLPSLDKRFVGAGQFGSRGGEGSMESVGLRGVRDIQEGLEQQRLATLSGAYGQAGQLFGQDRARQIQAGQVAGGLGLAGGQLGLQAGRQMGALGEAAQQLGLRGAGALEAVGQQQQAQDQRSLDLAYGDFREQRDLPFERLGFMSDMIRGLPYSRATQTEATGPSSVYQPSPLSQAIGAYGAYRGLTSARGGRVRYAKGGPVTVEGDYEVIYDD